MSTADATHIINMAAFGYIIYVLVALLPASANLTYAAPSHGDSANGQVSGQFTDKLYLYQLNRPSEISSFA